MAPGGTRLFLSREAITSPVRPLLAEWDHESATTRCVLERQADHAGAFFTPGLQSWAISGHS